MKADFSSMRRLTIAALACGLGACAPLSPNLDANFGTSVNRLKAYQTMWPSASDNRANPGMDGSAAGEAYGRYLKSFRAPTPHPNVFTIGVGGGQQ